MTKPYNYILKIQSIIIIKVKILLLYRSALHCLARYDYAIILKNNTEILR